MTNDTRRSTGSFSVAAADAGGKRRSMPWQAPGGTEAGAGRPAAENGNSEM